MALSGHSWLHRTCPLLAHSGHLFQHRYEEAVVRLADGVRDGRLRYREDIVDGIEHCPGAIAELYRGENLGKRLILLRNHEFCQ